MVIFLNFFDIIYLLTCYDELRHHRVKKHKLSVDNQSQNTVVVVYLRWIKCNSCLSYLRGISCYPASLLNNIVETNALRRQSPIALSKYCHSKVVSGIFFKKNIWVIFVVFIFSLIKFFIHFEKKLYIIKDNLFYR